MSVILTSSEELKFHQWPEGTFLKNYKSIRSDEGPIKTVSWGRDGSWVVLVPNSGATEVISIKDNVKLLQAVQDISNPMCATFQNGSKKNVAIGTIGGHVFVYDIKVKNIRKHFPKVNCPIINVKYNYKDTHIAAGCSDGQILLFNSISANISSSYVVPKSETVSAINFHRTKQSMLAAASDEGVVAAWDFNKNALLCHIQAHQAPVTDLKFSPTHLDLLFTSGLDRKFCCYDLLTKKCIIDIEIPSSITALDFSYCGTYLGLGCQNGNVVLYDARKLNKPISTFTAHDGRKIRQLLFQKMLVAKDEQEETSFNVFVNESSKLQEDNKHEMTDSLGFIGCDYFDTQIQETLGQKSVQECEDSFLNALGLNNNSTNHSIVKVDATLEVKTTEDLQKLNKSKQASVYQNKATLQPIKDSHITSVKEISSTPKHVLENLSVPIISPIINETNILSNNCNISTDNLKRMIRDIVKEEIQNEHKIYKQELAEMVDHIDKNLIQLQMFLCKEFVNIENKLNNL